MLFPDGSTSNIVHVDSHETASHLEFVHKHIRVTCTLWPEKRWLSLGQSSWPMEVIRFIVVVGFSGQVP